MEKTAKNAENASKKDIESRPWGFFQILSDESDHKVKRITVKPAKRLSLQSHRRRQEHWYIVSGKGRMTLDDDDFRVKSGDSVDIAKGAAHRIENIGEENLVFVEIQIGDYFGEDDIVRYEDDYGRA